MKRDWLSRLFLYFNALLVLAVFSPIFFSIFKVEQKTWSHLKTYVLPEAIVNTLGLVLSVSLVTLFVGGMSGWICSQWEFKGRRMIGRLLVLPLALPAYILAFVYRGLFDFTGEWRLWFLQHGWFENFYIHGYWGVCFVLSLSLYPYVYLFSYSAFSTQGKKWREVAQSLGRSRGSSFFQVEWGICCPWILSGVALVAMEVVSDFGAVAIFNYDTLSTSIYKVWFGMQSWAGAAQIASFLILLVFILSFFRLKPMKSKYYAVASEDRPSLSMTSQILVYLFLGGLILFSLVIPVSYLCRWAIGSGKSFYFLYAKNSFILGMGGAFCVSLLTFLLSYYLRIYRDRWSRLCGKVFYLGYALPGTVLAVGLLGAFVFLGRVLEASLLLMFLGYIIRFQPLGLSQLSSAFGRISPHIDESAIVLSHSGLGFLRKIHFPILKKSVGVVGVLVFIEIIKEMPLTLMLRPFGWDTLAVKIFEFTSEGDWERAALPALIIVCLGLWAAVRLESHA